MPYVGNINGNTISMLITVQLSTKHTYMYVGCERSIFNLQGGMIDINLPIIATFWEVEGS